MPPDQFTEYLLTFAGAIAPGGVIEVTTEFDRAVERSAEFRSVRAGPPSEPPHTVTDLAYF